MRHARAVRQSGDAYDRIVAYRETVGGFAEMAGLLYAVNSGA
jgi:hypothetical protein